MADKTGGGPPLAKNKEPTATDEAIMDALGETKGFIGQHVFIDTPLFPPTPESPRPREPKNKSTTPKRLMSNNLNIKDLQVSFTVM